MRVGVDVVGDPLQKTSCIQERYFLNYYVHNEMGKKLFCWVHHVIHLLFFFWHKQLWENISFHQWNHDTRQMHPVKIYWHIGNNFNVSVLFCSVPLNRFHTNWEQTGSLSGVDPKKHFNFSLDHFGSLWSGKREHVCILSNHSIRSKSDLCNSFYGQ